MTTLVLANVFEYNWRNIGGEPGEAEFDAWWRPGVDLADMALFWGGDHSLVVTPKPLNSVWLADLRNLMDWRDVEVVTPRTTSRSLCEDLLQDADLLAHVEWVLRTSERPDVVAWGATPQLAKLLSRLRETVSALSYRTLPEPETFWRAYQLDSKAGFRHVVAGLRSLRIKLAPGFVFPDVALALESLFEFSRHGRGAVIKAAHGTAGFSLIRVSPDEFAADPEKVRRMASARMRFDSTWNNGPVVVEEWVRPTPPGSEEALTADFLVEEDGTVRVVGYGRMLLRRGQHYAGIVTGRGVVDEAVRSSILAIGRELGEAVAAWGYRGLFDVDFVLNADRRPIVTEMNARRASPSHVFEIARRLRGEDWSSNCCVRANDHVPASGASPPTYRDLREAARSYLKEQAGEGVDLVLTIVSSSLRRRTPYFGFLLIADDATRAEEQARRFESRVAS